eukprot:scaffold1010_cov334-Prasinococcus_capsulatus_cf.AAC.6
MLCSCAYVACGIPEGKSLPTELRRQEEKLREEIDDEDELTAVPHSHIDDEYAMAGKREPRVLVTTSRDPSTKLAQFAKELKLLFPNSMRMNRGSHVMSELVQGCRSNDFTDIVVVHEHRGEPDGLIVCHLPFGPTVRAPREQCVEFEYDLRLVEN